MVKEKAIQKQVIDACRMLGVKVIKLNNVGIFKQDTGHYIPSTCKGLPDLIVLLKGQRVIWWEVKAEKGRQNDNQKAFQAEVEALGHRYYLIRSAQEALDSLVMEGAALKTTQGYQRV